MRRYDSIVMTPHMADGNIGNKLVFANAQVYLGLCSSSSFLVVSLSSWWQCKLWFDSIFDSLQASKTKSSTQILLCIFYIKTYSFAKIYVKRKE